jgi:hypothetical protein
LVLTYGTNCVVALPGAAVILNSTGTQRLSEAVTLLAVNPKLLIMVKVRGYSTNLTEFGKLPVKLNVEDRLVYSPHAYAPKNTLSGVMK